MLVEGAQARAQGPLQKPARFFSCNDHDTDTDTPTDRRGAIRTVRMKYLGPYSSINTYNCCKNLVVAGCRFASTAVHENKT